MVEVTFNEGRRIDFALKKFDDLLRQKSYNLVWEKSGMCPCTDRQGVPILECALCKGKSFYYFDSSLIKGLIQGVTSDKYLEDYSNSGDWIVGKSFLTTRACDQVSLRDRITNVDSIITYSQLVTRDQDIEAQEPTDPTDDASSTAVTRLRYPVISVLKVRTQSTVFIEGTDFRITKKGRIEWLTAGPSRHEVVSYVYKCHPVWIALDTTHVIRDTTLKNETDAERFAQMPRQVVISLEFFVDGVGVSSSIEDEVVPE